MTALLAVLFVAFLAATLLPTPSSALSVARNVFVLPIPFAVCWAYRRTPPHARLPIAFFAAAALVWLAGTVVWYAYFFTAGGHVPKPPTAADGFFTLGRLLIIAAIVAALRSTIRFTIAALDAVVIVAAGLAVGAALIGHRLEEEFTASTLVTLNGPVLGVVILMLIVSAAVGSWEGIPRSFVFLGAGTAALTIGTVVYSFQAVRETYADDRWAGLPWAAAAVLILLGAARIVLRIDDPVRIAHRAEIPDRPPGANAALILSLGALGLTLSVAFYGYSAGIGVVASVGVIAGITVGVAMALRASEAIRTAEHAYARLDRALADLEHSHDQLQRANEDLQRANVEMKTLQIALADALNLADERSHGRMRELIEDTGEELAQLLEQHLEKGSRP